MVQVVNNCPSENLLFFGHKGIYLCYILSYLIFATIFEIDIIIPIT